MTMAEPYKAVVRRRGDWLVASVLGLLGVSAVAETAGNLTIALRSELAKKLNMPALTAMPEVLLLDPDGNPFLAEARPPERRSSGLSPRHTTPVASASPDGR